MNYLTVIGTVVCEDIETPKAESPPPPGLGGSAVYACAAAQSLQRAHLIGAVGDDFPERHERRLRSLNIDLTGLEVKKGKTFYWKASYAPDLLTRETLALELGVYENYQPLVPAELRRSDFVLIANLVPQAQAAALDQLERPAVLLLGTIDHWVRTARDCLTRLLPRVDGFFANEEEMRLLAGLEDPIESAKQVAKLGSKFVVVTLAERGAVLVLGHELWHVPAFPCTTIQDPTGAGDSFAGGFLASLARDRITEPNEKTLVRAMLYGTALASLCLEDFSIVGLCRANMRLVESRVSKLRAIMNYKVR
jgi:sugar/nucleoside kinase (ribokinase family)